MAYSLIVPSTIMQDNRLSGNAKLCYCFIQFRANQKGYCWASNSHISKELNLSKSFINKIIHQLKKYNYIDIKYIKKGKSIQRRDIFPLVNKGQEIEIETNNDFDLFWSAYPVKKGKATARKSFKKVKIDINILLAAIEAQKKDNSDYKYWKHPSTWLNAESWHDEVSVQAVTKDEFRQLIKDNKVTHEEVLQYVKDVYKSDIPYALTKGLLENQGRIEDSKIYRPLAQEESKQRHNILIKNLNA